MGECGAEALREARYIFGWEKYRAKFGVVFGELGEVARRYFRKDVHHDWDPVFVAAASPLGLLVFMVGKCLIQGPIVGQRVVSGLGPYHTIHTFESLDVGIIVC
jgi:hypothetical protein